MVKLVGRIRIVAWDADILSGNDPIGVCSLNLHDLESAHDSKNENARYTWYQHPTWMNIYGTPRNISTDSPGLLGLGYGSADRQEVARCLNARSTLQTCVASSFTQILYQLVLVILAGFTWNFFSFLLLQANEFRHY
eukprot:SAG31_NODE_50_length_30520_cov_89.906712_25_plen_137_part_00